MSEIDAMAGWRDYEVVLDGEVLTRVTSRRGPRYAVIYRQVNAGWQIDTLHFSLGAAVGNLAVARTAFSRNPLVSECAVATLREIAR